MKPIETIEKFDLFLADIGKSFSAIIIGGGALSLMRVITRETQDIDVLEPILSQAILQLSQEFADQINHLTPMALKRAWLNNGPESLRPNLPEGWHDRIQKIFAGRAIELYALGRSDLLKTKLFAFCDREQDRQDCLLMNPDRDELKEAMIWVKVQDMNPLWPKHVELSLQGLAKELGYGL